MLKFLAQECKLKGRSKISKNTQLQTRKKLERAPDLEEAIEKLILKYGKNKES